MLKGSPVKEVLDEAVSTQIKAEDHVIELDMIYETYCELESVKTKKFHATKLPKMSLPKFNGDILTFTHFWEKFEASVHSRDMPDTDKFSYLYSCLEGEASKALEGFTISNANYNVAIEKLWQRFGRKDEVVDAHYNALCSLPKAKDTPAECRCTLDTIETHLRVLETLGEEVDSNHLRVTLKGKFPNTVLYQVNLRTGKETTVKSMREALDIVISAMVDTTVPSTVHEENTNQNISTPATTEALHTRVEESNRRKRKMDTQTKTNPKRPRRELKCVFCSDSHYADECTKYKSLKERRSRLKDRCFRCFQTGHSYRKCKAQRKCAHCTSKQHHRALCKSKIEGKTSQGKDPLPIGSNHETSLSDSKCLMNINRLPFLQTAVTIINNKNCRLLLDSGSQRSYISCRLAKTLNLTPDQEDLLLVYTFGSDQPMEMKSPSAEVTLKTKRGVTKEVRVNIVPHITERAPIATINPHPSVDFLADDDSVGEGVDILIGNDFYFSFIREERLKIKDHVYLVNSDFGWLISGHTMNNKDESVLSVVTYCQCHQSGCAYFTEPDLPLRDIDMRFLWTLESIGITDSPKSTREDEAVKYFNETTKYNNGRYEVKWPWVQYPPDLPTNYGIAYGRLKGLLKKCDEQTLIEYNTILQEQLKAGIIEAVQQKSSPMTQTVPPTHYLPHHMVRQSGKSGRLVYDASAKLRNEKSLNECLYSGPSMLEDLTGLLLKFRMGKIGITADVEKAFLQVALQEDDRDVTRFLWVKDPSKELTQDNLMEFRFTRVCFGVIASPFLLTATIRFHMARTNETLLSKLADKCYVDNLILTANSPENALCLYEEARKAFGEMSMNIRDWVSNDIKLLQNILKEQQAKPTEHVKVLGLMWNPKKDSLKLNLNKLLDKQDDENITKKDVLRTLARLYDPCGLVSPAVMGAKLVFQELCVRKLKWDSPLPEDMRLRWKSALANMKSAADVEIPRYVGKSMPENCTDYELHCFCDASMDAYAAVVYLRIVSGQRRKTVFMMSKAKVTPHEDRQDLKIPRLELLAFLIGNRLLKYVKANLDVTCSRLFLWTDSQIVLAWMKSNKLLPPFVQRRVNEIKQHKDVELRYVSTKENPADIATRPELWTMKQELWFSGPPFLSKTDTAWPSGEQIDANTVLLSAGEVLDVVDGPEMTGKGYEEEDYAIYEVDPPTIEFHIPMEEDDSHDKQVEEIKKLQAQYFPQEVAGEETSLKRNLGTFIDENDGLLRCKGRLDNAMVPYDTKYPILIPKDCTFTNKIIQKIHEENLHVGVSQTLNTLRGKYWIPQGRTQVKKILKQCLRCIKHGGGPYKLPEAPALPSERVNYSTPFTYIGMDYLGPLYVSTSTGVEKRWICLITCLATRAVHLELVKDMTAEECLLGLRRFIAARGLPKKIITDNALYFRLVAEVLSKPYCTENNIRWKFIPQLAPWHGGFYERLVALVKNSLKRTLGKHSLNDQQLLTVVKEVETVINSRPLTCVGVDLEHVLRPIDFLSFRNCLMTVPSDDVTGAETSTKVDLIGSWRKGQVVLNEFRKMFTNQYLTSLREKYQHSYKQPRVKSSRSPQIGDVVQIKDDNNKNRDNWKVGRLSALVEGADGQLRIAKVKVGDKEFTRSLGHLYPLEADIDDPKSLEQAAEAASVDSVNPPLSEDRPPTEMEVDISIPIETQTDQIDEQIDEQLDRQAEMESEDVVQTPSEKDKELADIQDREVMEQRPPRRDAAVRARAKMAEWTRQLEALAL